MKKLIKLSFLFALILFGEFSYSQNSYGGIIKKGNEAYRNKDFKKAEKLYKESTEKKENPEEAKFNLGDALYKQKKYNESAQLFKEIAESTKDNELKSNSWHNYGNALLQDKKYEESIEAYKNSLRLNPEEKKSRYNMSYALEKLKKQKQEQMGNIYLTIIK
jgi:tetratricopeptide (TPR) repeat protein